MIEFSIPTPNGGAFLKEHGIKWKRLVHGSLLKDWSSLGENVVDSRSTARKLHCRAADGGRQ
jgi:hypothetical protein